MPIREVGLCGSDEVETGECEGVGLIVGGPWRSHVWVKISEMCAHIWRSM